MSFGFGYQSNYPSNSGPPPPPGASGGFFAANAAPSAYNVNQFGGFNASYQQNYSYGQSAVFQGGQQVSSNQYGYPLQNVVLPPQADQILQQYGMQPPAIQPAAPPSAPAMPFTSYLNHVNTQIYDQQADTMRQMQDMMANMALEMKSMKDGKAVSAASQEEKREEIAQNVDVKAEIKRMFVDELMRREAVAGTFEITEGTVKPFQIYASDDPVAAWYREKRDEDLVGKPWNPEADCEYLRGAMKGLGTDEAKIIHIVTTRCNAQRQKLKDMFKTMYGRDLISDINSELSGDFRQTVMACFVKPPHYDAWSVKEAIYGLGTDEQALIEIMMTRTNAQLKEMREVYPDVASPKRKAMQTLLEKDIKGDTSGDFKRLLLAACQGNRYEIDRARLEQAVEELMIEDKPTGTFDINYRKLVDIEKAKKDAMRLFKAGEERWGTDEEEFNLIFSTRDYYHLREVWNEYVKISQRDILNSIDRETSGDYKRGLRAIVMNIRCRPMYFAERLRAAMKGLGTDDDTLIRIVVSRSEIDMIQIKKCFLELTKQTLWRWIKDDTSGDYKRMLLALVGKD